MFRRILAIVKKEIRHILRDPRTLAIVFAMPVMMVLLFGYALNMDVKHIPIGFVDYDQTPDSRALIERFSSSEYFDRTVALQDIREVAGHIKNRSIKAALVIPKNFSRDVETRPTANLQLIVDGSDPTFGNATVNYSSAILSGYAIRDDLNGMSPPLDIRVRFLYNPDLEGSFFIIPGLVAVILMMICALLTSITIAREKETGTMDVLLVSPVRPVEIIIGKLIPYVVLGILDAVFILFWAKLLFAIPLRGDLGLLFALSVIFIYSALGIGLFISSVSPNQQVAMMAALVATILPSIILSGFIFPIFSMPAPIRAVTSLVPAKYYMTIIRGILLKSSTLDILWGPALFLFLLGTFFFLLAAVRFNTRES